MSGSRSLSSGRSLFGIFGRAGSKIKSVRARFLIRFLVYFIVAFLFWIVVTPVGASIYAFVGGKIIYLLDDYGMTKSIHSSGKTIVLKYAPSDGKPQLINSRTTTFNVVFLLALIMAVPDVRNNLRLKIILIGVGLLIPVQLVRLVVWVFNYYSQHIRLDGELIYPYFWRKTLIWSDRTLARLDSMLIPVVIWAGLFYYYKWNYKFKKPEPVKEPTPQKQGKKKKKKRFR
jgi:hypothetical protein